MLRHTYWWFLELGVDTLQLSARVCMHLPTSSQKIQRIGLVHNTVLKKYEKVKEPTVLFGFFHETHWFCKVFELTGTSGSLDSGIVEEPEPAVL
jgi:hypothetical protein